jgi:hypothetical protein
MRTEIYEADPFTGTKTEHFLTLDTDYRFEARDELFLTLASGKKLKVRVTHVRVEVSPQGLRREIVVQRL